MSILGRGGTISERIRNVLTDWIWYYSSVCSINTPDLFVFHKRAGYKACLFVYKAFI